MNGAKVINTILEKEGLKAGTFAKRIGVTTTQVYDLQKGKVKGVSGGFADKILAVFPNYDKAWLMTGLDIPKTTLGDQVVVQLPGAAANAQMRGIKIVGGETRKTVMEGVISRLNEIRPGRLAERVKPMLPKAGAKTKPVGAAAEILAMCAKDPAKALWVATGQDMVVMTKEAYEATSKKIKVLEDLIEIQKAELRQAKAAQSPPGFEQIG